MMRHYSWAISPEEAKKKVRSWAHAHQLVSDWFDDVFLSWKPGVERDNFNPTTDNKYYSVFRDELERPEVLFGHPYWDCEVIEKSFPLGFNGKARPKREIVSGSEGLKLVTVDDGNGVSILRSMTEPFREMQRIVMWKSDAKRPRNVNNLMFVDYDASLKGLLDADMALFGSLSDVNFEDFRRILEAGVPVVVNNKQHRGLIKHGINGLTYWSGRWGYHWIEQLSHRPDLRRKLTVAAMKT